MPDLSILIPARNELFLVRTVADILENVRGDTEVIVVLDEHLPTPPIPDDRRVHIVYHSNPPFAGQRGGVNEAARLATGKYVMKVDAHCALDEGFDVKLIADMQPDWTVIPRQWNLHAFDWVCNTCGGQTDQGPTPVKCDKCKAESGFTRKMVWERRKRTDYWRFDQELHFQYWPEYKDRPEANGDIVDVMSCLGACWMMERERFWKLGGMDEGHGSWGQMGTELACKSWLSGGRMVVNKKTWFAHMFRTQGGDFGFPYEISNKDVSRARAYSRHLWLGNTWPMQVHPLAWLIDKFAPVPGWHDPVGRNDLAKVKAAGAAFEMRKVVMLSGSIQSGESIRAVEGEHRASATSAKKGAVYYTDNRLDPAIMRACQRQLARCCDGNELVSVSQKPTPFGLNVVLPIGTGILSMFKQQLAGLEKCRADVVFFCEHDVLYHPSHFDFVPEREDVFYYNRNFWKVNAETGHALFYYTMQTAGLCAYRDLLVEHYRKRVARVEREGGYDYWIGFEPGSHQFPRGIDGRHAETWMSVQPNIDIRHATNLTASRWSRDQFRSQRFCQGWAESDSVPGWGKTKGRFAEFLKEVTC